jgi:hypothetical protein
MKGEEVFAIDWVALAEHFVGGCDDTLELLAAGGASAGR